MTFDFFEGAAGTGKTHNLVSRAGELVQDGVLGAGQKLLALTFMNGARRRLEARLAAHSIFRRRFDCQTFDVFARTLAARLRSSLTSGHHEQAEALSEFDGPCFLAMSLLGVPSVQKWVARSYPLVVVDEAQDLDDHRLGILQGLSRCCHIVAAADAFQCLADGRDTATLIGWLEEAGRTHRLTHVRRTQQQGLLAVALAVREGRDITALLTRSQRARRPTSYAQGFRLVETFATNAGIVARTIADEMSYRTGSVTILSPNMSSNLIRDALDDVHARTWNRRNGQTIGPFPLTWDRPEANEADAFLAHITLPHVASGAEMRSILTPHAGHAGIAQVINRIDRMRRVNGPMVFTAEQVKEFFRDSVRNQSRLGFRQHRGNLAMTVPRAKNREFTNVIVLWPHAVPGGQEHQKRLLYNAITRAQNHCSVIVLGEGRLNAPPFAPAN